MKNRNIISAVKLVVFQIFGVFFFSGVGSCFFRFYRSDVIECFAQSGVDVNCFSLLPPGYTLGKLMTEQTGFLLYGIAFGFALVAILNLVRKKSILYLLSVVGVTVLLFFTGFYKLGRAMDDWLRFFGNLFTKSIGTANLIAAICYFILGVVCIWLSVKTISLKKKNQVA
ncbi:hypothetical protein [Fluviicola sp.]|jgi:hypothetical protein|uniref:hypothetical protein n=1 Tax=Fluviicola sp. TaxID=1917219 RepID=UPI00282C513E|nr:hypothetical protein [Fluviicola sp.]MDR0803305.1 hypothetical protein [Fluviicola sp.]